MSKQDPLPPVDPVEELERKLMARTKAYPRSECFSRCYGNHGQGHDYAYPVLPPEADRLDPWGA